MSSDGGKEQFFEKIGNTAAAAGEGEGASAAGGGDESGADNAGDPRADETGITEVPNTLCMQCGQTGTTRMLLTLVPYFREIVVMSFACDSCGFRNTEVNFGGEIQPQGVRMELEVRDREDLNRQCIKADSATVGVPALQFEIPAKTQRGGISTIEGVLSRAITALQADQDWRRERDAETAEAIQNIITQLTMMAHGITLPFTLVLDDPAGNSFIENPHAPASDPALQVTHYTRSRAQDHAVGLQVMAEEAKNQREGAEPTDAALSVEASNVGGADRTAAGTDGEGDAGADAGSAQANERAQLASSWTTGKAGGTKPLYDDGLASLIFGSHSEEAMRFPCECYACRAPGETRMCITSIPHFREIIIMAFSCDKCGFKSNEIKAGGAIPEKGQRITLRVKAGCVEDMGRDVLKSDSAGLSIPEVGLEMEAGSLGGVYTTVEGLLKKVRGNLIDDNPFFAASVEAEDGDGGDGGGADAGDSVEPGRASKMRDFVRRFDELLNQDGNGGEGTPFTLVISDPVASSFVYSPLIHDATRETPGTDPQLDIEEYTRTWDENEGLGLHDMVTEDYGGEQAAPPAPERNSGADSGAVASVPKVERNRVGVDEFTPCDSFSGAREGQVFKLGDRGLGYYGDASPIQVAATAPATNPYAYGGRPMPRSQDHPVPLNPPQ